MVTHDQLERSKAIQRRTGRTFHVATRFLPERVRHPTYVLYAFFRTADEVVDDTDPPPAEAQRERLVRLRDAALGEREATDPVVAAFAELCDRQDVPDREVEAFVDAMLADVDATGYETYADLEEYLRGSAVAVAYMMLAVMDPAEADAARPHARALGEAFQLTNFLRDVREDVVDYDRIYLPQETLERFGVERSDVADLRFSEDFAAAMRHELRRTEERYREGVAGIRLLPEDCQFPVLLSAVFYAEHHRLIRERGFDVLSDPPSLGLADYARLTARTWWHWWRLGEPAAVFYAVSAVPTVPEVQRGSGAAAREPEDPTTRAGAVSGSGEPTTGAGEATGSGEVTTGAGEAATEPGATTVLAGAGGRIASAVRSRLPSWRPE